MSHASHGLFPRTASRLIVPAVLFLTMAAPAVWAQELVAVIQEVEGTVEIQVDAGPWETAQVGDVVPIGARISTGFGARAVVAVGENATVTVGSLTRLGIDQLVEEEGVERSELNLEIGRVRGEVREVDVDRTEFDLRSPIATASVRGTSFDFTGSELSVTAGVVRYQSVVLGREIIVGAQEVSSTDGVDPPEDGASGRAERGAVRHETEGGDDDAALAEDVRVVEGPATVTVVFGGYE